MRLILFNKNGNSSNKVIERIEIYMICKMRVLIGEQPVCREGKYTSIFEREYRGLL